MAISKFVLIVSGAGLATATAGGVVAYLNSGESIKDHIASQLGSNFKFISSSPEAKESLETRYEKGKDNKPRRNNEEITKSQIVGWCKEVENFNFSTETDPTYLSIKTWCFVNINTLETQAKQNSKEVIDGQDGNTEGWKKAWENYNTNKGNLEINDPATDGLKQATEKDKGGLALYNWCKSNDNKKMYEVNSEENYKRYEKWCFQ